MSVPLDHEACSALLRGYASGALEEAQADAVGHHLGGCARCRAELRGVAALRRAPGELTDAERDALHRGVAAAAATPDGVAAPSSEGGMEPRAWRPRLAPALAAAALVAVVLVAGASLLGGLTGVSSNDAGQTAGGAPEPEAVREGAGGDVGGAGGDDELRDTVAGRHGVRFAAAGELDLRDVVRLWRSGAQRAPLALQERAPRAPERFLDELSGIAPGRALTSQVRACARGVLGSRPPGSLPVFGATATVTGRKALVLVFADEDRYEAFAWPRGSCDDPLARLSGRSPR
ncbi:hypothetical protein BH24ACT26_BH24ACT26_00370 [soil metagenome]